MKVGDFVYNNEYNQKHEEDLQRLRGFRLLDDDFMTKCFEDSPECVELLLHILLEKSDLRVQEIHTQHAIKNLQGRSVRLDIYATDSCGKKYNIEVQRADKGAGVKRARYNSSVLDVNILSAGEDFEKLPETYVIFITENDVMGKGKPIYHIERCVIGSGEVFGDGSHILYVNGSYKDETPLGKLMYDFSCTDPADMHYDLLANRARYFKEDKEGVAIMCKAMEDMRNETLKEGMRAVALRMLEAGKYALEEIATISGLTIEDVEVLAERKSVE